MALPLQDLRVLDLSRLMAAPFATMMLGDMGADVTKLEPPDGDELRGLGPKLGGESALFLAINRNKRSIALDLNRPEGREVYFRLAKEADVIVENFMPAMKERWGIGYSETASRNPAVIYCSLSAFGQTGPYANRPGIDNVFQAMSGIMSVTGEPDGRPMRCGPPVADAVAGLHVAQAVTLALLSRAKTGQGQHVHVSLLDASIAIQTIMASSYFATGELPARVGNGSLFSSPTGNFITKDGAEIAINTFTDKFFRRLCDAVGASHLAHDPRFETMDARIEHRQALESQLADSFKTRTASEWLDVFEEMGVIAGKVNNYGDVFSDPQVLHNEMVVTLQHPTAGAVRATGIPIKLTATPGQIQRAAPLKGEHTDEILAEAGFDQASITSLREVGVVC